jgi:hypothetical protein
MCLFLFFILSSRVSVTVCYQAEDGVWIGLFCSLISEFAYAYPTESDRSRGSRSLHYTFISITTGAIGLTVD